MLWLWGRPVATAPIRPLAWEPLFATEADLKKAKKKKQKKKKKKKKKEREEGRKEGRKRKKGRKERKKEKAMNLEAN